MAELLRRLGSGELLSSSSTEEALHILTRQNLREMIPAKLPAGTIVANKTGTLTLPSGSVRTDAGIVYGPGQPFVLVCFSRELPSVLQGVDQIASLSRAVYDHYARG
jgi:beta-lactamase class A